MTYISLANKYRPQTFKEVVGQESIETTLMNAVKSGRIAPAYLFYGPRGCGKTTTARLLAKALNCQHGPTDEPCGKCPQCKEIAASADMDVLELDAASNTQVDKIREVILDSVGLAAGRDQTQGLPRTMTVTSDEIRQAILEPVRSIVDLVKRTLEETPPELAADLVDRGIVVAGGGSLLRGITDLIHNETDIPVRRAADPLKCVALGTGKCLEFLAEGKDFFID